MRERAAGAAIAVGASAVVAALALAVVIGSGAPPAAVWAVAAASLLQVVLVVVLATRPGRHADRRTGIRPILAPTGPDASYRRVVDQVEQVLFEVDSAARWTFLNRAWEAMTGREVAASIGQPVAASLHPDDRFEVEKLFAALLEGERAEGRLEVRILSARDEVVWGDVHARAAGTDGVRGVAGTITDVTARRQAQNELEAARLAAEKASAAKSEFLKSMSHEMRTPLNGVLGLMELLSSTALDAQQARYVSVARASATHLATLISDILDLSRIEGGGLPLERMLFDLPDLIESSVDAVASEAAIKRLRLSCTITQHVPTWVVGDSGRLRQVLVNLLVNAVRFTEAGEIHLQADGTVDLARRQAMIAVEVLDTGIGMPAEEVEGLFEPFATSGGTAPRRHSGAGLGLAICKHLVEAMGGSIEAHGAQGGGATFTIRLPLEIADAAMVEDRRAGHVPFRVLAVAARAADRGSLSRLLEGWRFDAAVVADADAAWGHVEATSSSRWRFGVVLLDAASAGASDLARRLREMSPAPGIIWILPQEAVTVPAFVQPRERVVKPTETTALFEAIMQAVVGAAGPADGARAPGWARPPRVLVAEDHDVNQMVVREMLRAMGCEVDLVADGEAAVDAVLAHPYDVVLMDCQMPVLDGLEATRRLRQARRDGRTAHDPKVIALTANATADDRRACLDAGMDAYLTKPVRGTILQRTLQRLLAGEPLPSDEPQPATEPVRQAVAGDRAALDLPPDAEDILDPEEVLLRCNHNPDLGARMLQLFAESLPAELEALEAAVTANDPQALARITHKLRGAAATLAAARLAGAITGIELYLKYGDGGPLSELMADVRHESALFLGVVPQTIRRLTGVPPNAPAGAHAGSP
jgi:PAS domain S-box-containing protein